MNDFLYIPIRSLNFNGIFATESISPPKFYSMRGFGNRRFLTSSQNLHEDYIFLYPSLPKEENTAQEEEDPIFFIQLPADQINAIEIHITEESKVFACDHSIYLNLLNPTFIFRNSEHKSALIAKSLSSLEAKTVSKFTSSFKLWDELKLTENYYKVEGVSVQENISINKNIEIDRKVNCFKGFIYGYIVGKMYPLTPKEIELKKTVQNILNAWGHLKSQIELNVPKYKKGSTIYRVHKRELKNNVSDLKVKQSLRECGSLLNSFFKSTPIEELIGLYLKQHGFEDHTKEEYISLTKKIPPLYEHLVSLAEKKDPTVYYYLKVVEELMEKYTTNAAYNNSWKEDIDKRIKDGLFKIEKSIDKVIYENYKSIQLPPLEHIRLEQNRISIGAIEPEDLLFEIILNTLLENSKNKTGEVSTEEKLDLIKIVGNKVKETFGEDFDYRKYLLQLYTFFQTKEPGISFSDGSCTALTNFFAFLVKPDSLEQLTNFLQTRYIKDSYIAYSYWGMYNGFGAMGRTFTQNILESSRFDLMRDIDSYLSYSLSHIIPFINTDAIVLKKESSGKKFLILLDSDVELALYSDWIKSCIQNITSEITFDATNEEDEISRLKMRLSSELLSKNKPKQYDKELVERTLSLIDFHELNKITHH